MALCKLLAIVINGAVLLALTAPDVKGTGAQA